MLTQGKRITLAAIIASAIGLSCAGCLGTSSLSANKSPTSPPVYQSYSAAEDPSLYRLGPRGVAPPERSVRVATSSDSSQLHRAPSSVETVPQRVTSYTTTNRSNTPAGTTLRPTRKVSGIDLTAAQFAQSIDQRHTPPVGYPQHWQQQNRQQIDAGYTFRANSRDTGLGVDLALSPRLAYDSIGDVRSTRAGAEVRIGRNLDQRGRAPDNSNWYLFAGADGEAVVWDVKNANQSLMSGQVSLQDKVTIGDVQAGLAWKSPAGHMSVSYIQREYEYRNGEISRSGEEDFVALTLTWRR